MTSFTAVPWPDELNSTSSTRARMSGMPRPRSKFRRSGSVTGGCSGSSDGSNPAPRSSMRTSRCSSSSRHRTSTRSAVSAAPCASMALVQASETAIFRSSIRSSASTALDAANDETRRRARATNSRRAGISSSTTSSTSSSRCECVVDGLVNREDLRQAGDLEDLEDPTLSAHEREVAVVASHPLQPSDQHAETGRVEEVDAFEIDEDPVMALAHELDEPLAEPRRRVDVDLAADGENRPPVPLGHLEAEVHRR